MIFILKGIRFIYRIIAWLFGLCKHLASDFVRKIANPSSSYGALKSYTQTTYEGGYFDQKREKEFNVVQNFFLKEYLLFKLFGQRESDMWNNYFSYFWGRNFFADDKFFNIGYGDNDFEIELIKFEIKMLISQMLMVLNSHSKAHCAPGMSLHILGSTSIPSYGGLSDSILVINRKICGILKNVNHWKFLREELYAILNLMVSNSNPISAYTTHSCELTSINNPIPNLKLRKNMMGLTGINDNLISKKRAFN